MDLTILEATSAVLVSFSERPQVFALLAVAPDPIIETLSSAAVVILYGKVAIVLHVVAPGVTILTPSSAVLVIL